MQVTVEIPDDMVRKLTQKGQDAARATLEALAIEGYRSGALTSHQTRRLLGFQTRYELDQVASILIGCCRMARALELRG